jgi:hypothetical protein
MHMRALQLDRHLQPLLGEIAKQIRPPERIGLFVQFRAK